MSLPLNQSYEIQDIRALEKIIDMTVEYLSATIESQGYQALTLENQQRD
jgi:uroporphyrinogen-III decarboxylase